MGLLLHCISSDSSDPLKDYKVVRKELEKFSSKLLKKNEVILLTKSDLVDNRGLKKTENKLKILKKNIVTTSIHDEKSLDKLIKIL